MEVDHEEFTKAKEMKMLRNRCSWSGETLCLKRRATAEEKAMGKGGIMGCTAFGVITSDSQPVTVHLRDETDEARDFQKSIQFASFEEMVNAGWGID